MFYCCTDGFSSLRTSSKADTPQQLKINGLIWFSEIFLQLADILQVKLPTNVTGNYLKVAGKVHINR